MAIVQSSLAEEILSRQERAVLRGIYRASQLAEAIMSLDKVGSVLSDSSAVGPKSGLPFASDNTNITELRSYLQQAIKQALVATKVPALSVSKDSSLPQKS